MLGGSAGECHRCDRGDRRAGAYQLGALPQDSLVQLGQVGAGIDAQFLDEELAHPAVLLKGLRLPPGPVQGDHQLPAQGLAQRVLLDQLAEFDDEFGGLTETQVEFEELLRGGQPALLDGGRRGLDDRAAATGQNRPPPQGESAAQYLRGFGRAALGSRLLRFPYQ